MTRAYMQWSADLGLGGLADGVLPAHLGELNTQTITAVDIFSTSPIFQVTFAFNLSQALFTAAFHAHPLIHSGHTALFAVVCFLAPLE